MNRNERNSLFVVAGVLLLGALMFCLVRSCARLGAPMRTAPVEVSSATITVVPSRSPVPVVTPPPATPAAPVKTAAPVHVTASAPPKTTSAGVPIPPTIELHKELIPKDIEIIRFHPDQEIVPPGTTLGFDINGSGFNKEFERMIKVEAGEPGIEVKNLHLITANQIHGDMQINADARTAFVFPRVLIQNLPVFTAKDPYAVIRKGEVLTIIFISMEDNGRAGRFRVLTNLDDALFQQFHIIPSTAGLDISDIVPRLPYAVEGTLRIGQRVPPGAYGMVVQIGAKTALSRDSMIRIVRPNVGSTGFVQAIMAAEPFHRPGDLVQLYVQGSGFIPENIQDLRAHVGEFDMGMGSFSYLNGGQMRLSFQVPAAAPVGDYGVTINNVQGQTLYEKKSVFQVVPTNWVAGVQVSPPVKAGGRSTLKFIGRDMSPDFVQAVKIGLDESGITISPLKRLDAATLSADISVDAKVAPGDYWLHLSANGKKIDPPFGSLIKVEAP